MVVDPSSTIAQRRPLHACSHSLQPARAGKCSSGERGERERDQARELASVAHRTRLRIHCLRSGPCGWKREPRRVPVEDLRSDWRMHAQADATRTAERTHNRVGCRANSVQYTIHGFWIVDQRYAEPHWEQKRPASVGRFAPQSAQNRGDTLDASVCPSVVGCMRATVACLSGGSKSVWA